MSDLAELIKRKNGVLAALDTEKLANNRRGVVELASEAARLETEIARRQSAESRRPRVAVNLISAASCLLDAGRTDEAARVLARALDFAERTETKDYIAASLAKLGATRAPGGVFRTAKAMIEGNANLRTPQLEAYEALRTHFATKSSHAIVQLPVGCGKTGAMAITPFGVARGRTLVIAPNLEIADNTYRKLDYTNAESFLRLRGVLANGNFPTCARLDTQAALQDADGADYVVSNIQQLTAQQRGKWLSRLPDDYFDLILVDEAHHNVAESWRATLAAFPDARIASFTATPFRADGHAVDGERVYWFPIARAIREGYIKNLAVRNLQPVQMEFVVEGETRTYSYEDVLELRSEAAFRRVVALSRKCNENIVDASIQCLNELRSGSQVRHQIIAATCSIDHAKAVRALYEERNYKAEVIHTYLEGAEKDRIRAAIRSGAIDVIVNVSMLGEGADYPTLGVAAIFRPYNHLMPYVQFIGRIMRVNVEGKPRHPDNRGFVVSHPGLYVDRWWKELKELDNDDGELLKTLATGDGPLVSDGGDGDPPTATGPRKFGTPMQVLDEVIEHFLEETFLPEEEEQRLDDLTAAIEARGFDLEFFGITREHLRMRLAERIEQYKQGRHVKAHVQPQRARQEAKRRLDERVKSAAVEVLSQVGMSRVGVDLPLLMPELNATGNLPAAMIMLNAIINGVLGLRGKQRDLATEAQLEDVHDRMDEFVRQAVTAVRARRKGK